MPDSQDTRPQNKLETLIENLFKTLDFDIQIEIEENPGFLYFNFTGKDQKRLQDYRGETVRAFAVLLQAYWDRHFPDQPMEIKCDVDREAQRLENDLKEQAFVAASSLKNPGDQTEIGPFNSYERRLIHLTLKEHPHVATESIGDGHQKRMRLTFKDTSENEN